MAYKQGEIYLNTKITRTFLNSKLYAVILLTFCIDCIHKSVPESLKKL
jgi:hypothetical protein